MCLILSSGRYLVCVIHLMHTALVPMFAHGTDYLYLIVYHVRFHVVSHLSVTVAELLYMCSTDLYIVLSECLTLT